MPVSFQDLQDAFQFVSAGGFGEHQAVTDRRSAKIHWHSDEVDLEEEWPDDVEDETYVAVPNKQDLRLGTALVFEFVRASLPDDYDEVSRIFSRRGAYARFKAFLERRGALERWYDFSDKAEEAALRAWCAENAIELEA